MAITLDFTIKGNNEITDRFYTESINLKGKIESKILDLVDSDGLIELPIGKLGDLAYIIVFSTNAKLILTTDAPETLAIPIKNLLVWNVGNLTGALTKIEVSTTSSEAIGVEVFLLGEI